MNYYNTHLTKTSDAKPITKNKLERGMVVKIRYKKATKSKDYMVLVLHPKWLHAGLDKLHALSFNSISPNNILKIAKNNKEVLSESKHTRKLDLPKLRINRDSLVFYTTEIKNEPYLKLAYRTFILDKIQSLSVVNYDWGNYDRIPPESEREK